MSRTPRHASEFDVPRAVERERANPLRDYLVAVSDWWRLGVGDPPSFPGHLEKAASAHDALQSRLTVQSLCAQSRMKAPNEAGARQEALAMLISSMPPKWTAWDAPMHKGAPSWLAGLLQELAGPLSSSAGRAHSLPLLGALLSSTPTADLALGLPRESAVHPWAERPALPWGYSLLRYIDGLPASEGYDQVVLGFVDQVIKVAQRAHSQGEAEHWRIFFSHVMGVSAMRAGLTERDQEGWVSRWHQVQQLAPPLPIHRPWPYLPQGVKAGPEWIGEPEVLLGFFAASAPLLALSAPETAGASFKLVQSTMERRHDALGHWPKMGSFRQAQEWLEQRLKNRDPALVMAWKVRLDAAALEQAILKVAAPSPAADEAPVARRRM